jgi:hypothetical protein
MPRQVKALETNKPWKLKIGRKTFNIRFLGDICVAIHYRDEIYKKRQEKEKK